MAKLLKLRRGTTSQHSSFTGAEGEVTVDTDKESLVVHDGSTAGGFPIARADGTGVTNFTISGELDAATLDISGDADIDGTLEADAITVNGTALDTHIAGVTATNATNSAHVLVTDNESTDEENLITFVEDATSSTGNVGLEMDGHLTYNPSSGTVTATVFKGNIDAVDGDFDGTLEADAITIGGTAIDTHIAGVTVTNATNAAHVSVADNENTNENNLITFIEDASSTGNVGLESDGDFHYNPSTGTVTATTFAGNLTGNVTGNTSGSAGSCTGNAATATTSGHVTVTDNESTNENNLVAFVEDAQSSTGSHGLEMDGNFTYNPSSGTVTATAFAGALTGNVTGNASGTAATVTGAAQSAITSVGTLTGLTVAGDVTLDNGTNSGKDVTWDESENHVVFQDDTMAKFGGGGDLAIYHNATDSYITNSTGDLYVQTSGSGDDVIIQAVDDIFLKPQGGESGIEVIGDGAVSLYHNDAAKLATSATGVTVTGTLAATAVTGDGSGLTGVGGGPPTGSVIWFADDSAPTGWLECNGAAVSRSTYSDLFGVISTTWGAGDGSSTFNVPDLRGEFIRGWDNSKGTDSGRSFASSQAGANKEHNHDASVDSQGAHSHTVYLHHDDLQWPGNFYGTRRYAPNHDETMSTSSNGAHTHTVTVDNEGNAAGPYPRNFALLPIIKT